MRVLALKTSSARQGLIQLDPRTFLFLILLTNVTIFLTPSIYGELLLIVSITILALLCGVYSFSLKLGIIYTLFLMLDYAVMAYFENTWLVYVALGVRYMRKVFPTGLLGGMLILTVRVSELMASLTKMYLPKAVIIPLTVLLRYFPSIGEDRRAIKKAMAMRGLTGNFFAHPVRSIECLYVPLMMSASRRADELSCAAVTRGIEKPGTRTTMADIRFRMWDLVVALIFSGISAFCIGGVT